NQKGKFILRIEDTDVKRSERHWIDNILEGLRWLGIGWDEGPYLQSRRQKIYKKYLEILKEKKKVYPCFCTPEDIQRRREAGQFLYDRRCYQLPDDEIKRRVDSNIPYVYRFLMPDQTIIFEDLIHGEIRKEGREIEDFVVVRPDSTPTYNFACVVDDHEMGITHVIRAHEHIANTPKQIVLYEALGIDPPSFVHIPLILGPDRKKLSKRHGAISLLEYQKQGYLPEAMVNFLALLGWTPSFGREIVALDEMIEDFSLKRIHRSDAVFDIQKLDWMNGYYIRNLEDSDLLDRVKSFFIDSGYLKDTEFESKKDWLSRMVKAYKPRLKRLSDIIPMAEYIFKDDYPVDEEAEARLITEKTQAWMKTLADRYEEMDHFDHERCESTFRSLISELGIKAKELIHPIRVKITGRTEGPGLFEVMAILGKERTIERLRR
ncbi:MAG TPA: glutamate--tRNA ligase, partial [bacterium (Candidatus Stahlbacteria)]|nr:glutamate--tRNA ligase [Candidatus Stahlbacteria bacterium]